MKHSSLKFKFTNSRNTLNRRSTSRPTKSTCTTRVASSISPFTRLLSKKKFICFIKILKLSETFHSKNALLPTFHAFLVSRQKQYPSFARRPTAPAARCGSALVSDEEYRQPTRTGTGGCQTQHRLHRRGKEKLPEVYRFFLFILNL